MNAKYSLMNDQEIIENTSESLKNGDAIGWFQGRMEFGPRALGGDQFRRSKIIYYAKKFKFES